ncbi:hypothetical protein EDC04DRAFT_2814702 [Pisolithus marmoratus]|nr:hypothetical protein EDC04DRAFT_2814702 [Pisolithus marmoratus]
MPFMVVPLFNFSRSSYFALPSSLTPVTHTVFHVFALRSDDKRLGVMIGRLDGHTARARRAGSTPHTRLPSTRRAKIHCMHRESAVTTVSNRVTVARRSKYSTKRPRPPRRSSLSWSAPYASTRSN